MSTREPRSLPVLREVGEVALQWLQIHSAFKPFAGAQPLLILASGTRPGVLGMDLPYPKGSIRADFRNYGGQDLLFDNTRTFPLRDASVAGAYMGKGICSCPSATPGSMCCGVKNDVDGMRHLLGELARVVDWKNPRALAVLSGNFHGDRAEQVLEDWRQTLATTPFPWPVAVKLVRERQIGYSARAQDPGELIAVAVHHPGRTYP